MAPHLKSQLTNGLKISPSAVVCEEAKMVGDITIGARTVVHPKAQIIAEAGPIIIGDNNLIEEQAQIVNRHPAGPDGGPTNPNQTVMIIGNNNVFEVGAYSASLKVGDHNILEGKSRVGRQTILSNGCIIGAMCDVSATEELPENTVIYGLKCQRRVQQERPAPQTLQLDFLSKILPNYHHLLKPPKGSK